MKLTERGTFAFLKVLPTKQRISVSGIPEGGFVASAKYGSDDLLIDPFTPRENQELEIHISFLTGGLSGSVFDSMGNPAPGALVTLIPEQSKRDRLDRYLTRTTDGKGHFEFSNVPAGIYSVFAWDDIPGGAEQSPEFIAPYEERGATAHVQNGSTENMRLQIISF